MFPRTLFGLALTVACVAAPAADACAQVRDDVGQVLARLERVLASSDRAAFPALFASSVAPFHIDSLTADLFRTGASEAAVRERDRAPLEGVPPGDGYRLVVDFFVATPGRGRVLTASVDVQRPAGGDADSWRIVDFEGLTSVEGLYTLRVNATPRTARGLTITSEDLTIVLPDGTVFMVECDDGVTGLVLLGRGEMRFAPAPATERGQLRIFAGSETLTTPFDSAFVRVSPADYQKRVSVAELTDASAEPRLLRRAQEIFARESPKSFNVDLQDLSGNDWYLLPPGEDLLAEVDTRRHGVLTYIRSSAQAEDVTLLQRRERRTISLYASAAKIAARGRFYSDDALRDYDVLDYNIEATVDPARRALQARARLSLRVRGTGLASIMLRLAEPLLVRDVTSVEYGPLLHLRVRGQNTILVNLPRTAAQDSDLTLVVDYAGLLPSQELDVDTVQVSRSEPPALDPSGIPLEVNFVLSSRSYWYPQNPVPDYATATIRCTVPRGVGCLASGSLVPPENVVPLRDVLSGTDGASTVFRADQPLRYLALVASRFVRVAERVVVLDPERAGGDIDRVAVAVEANPRLQSRGRLLASQVEDIVAFYADLVGDAPFTSTTVALVESELPGGHSPGYFVILNEPMLPTGGWRGDPAAFDNFPEFFIAHELAHQWWGQAVGWKNYHEQWLSEGFAQYFAALYAQRTRGERVFSGMLRQFRRWAISQDEQGPVHLGYRLGHLKNDLRVYRALVYNKGAGVLHMLRRLVGDDVFFRALGRFYTDRRFQKAGTDDLQRAFEAESGRELGRFFERWIYSTGVPRVRYASRVEPGAVVVSFEQPADRVFDLPVTVTVAYADGRTADVIVPLTESRVEQVIPTQGTVRRVQVNRDDAAIAEFYER